MKVLLIHFRSAPAIGWKQTCELAKRYRTDSAGSDGVSLEMKKRRDMLEAMGHKVAVCSACEWAEFPLPNLEFDSDETRKMMRNLFRQLEDFAGEAELKKSFNASMSVLKQGLGKAISDFIPEMIFVHNIFCLPIHPAATLALSELLREFRLPCAAIHHDILSEGAYKFTPTCDFAKSILEGYFPPVMPNLSHWTINSRNQKALKDKGIAANVIYDTMNFDDQLVPEIYARLREEIRTKHDIKPHDVVLFVGARIVPNKQIEIAGHLSAILQTLCQNLISVKLYHGKLFSEQSRIILVLAGRPEAAFLDCKAKLFKLFDKQKISWIYAGDDICPGCSQRNGFYALYPDMYTMADFVLYPSGWEGFGNQLLEAFAACLPVAVFEYPVFKEDIASKGVDVVSLGDTVRKNGDGFAHIPGKILDRAALEIIDILTTPEKYRSITANNIAVGKRYFSFDVLRVHLSDVLEWVRSVKV